MKNLVTVSIDRRYFLSAYANYASVMQIINSSRHLYIDWIAIFYLS